MTLRRVAVTGLGVVSPHGSDLVTATDAVFRGASAIVPVHLFSDVGTLSTAGAIVTDEPWRLLQDLSQATCDRVSLFALAAAEAAIADAQLVLPAERLDRIGIAVGTSHGGTASQEHAYQQILGRNKGRLSPFTLVKVMYNGPAAQIAMRLGVEGPCLTYTTTCSSSAVSIGDAMRSVRHGYTDIMIAGGTDAPFSYVSLMAWQALRLLAPFDQTNVSRACRPFSLDRNGTVLGEGAAFLVLEEMERALKRGAHIYAELAGYGVCNDSLHLTQPSVRGQALAMRLALGDAAMQSNDIDYVNAHGTGTRLNDLTETQAIKEVFGDRSHNIAISSTKSTHGHLIGAASALELVISVKAIELQFVPPTANLYFTDPDCDLDYVPNSGRSQPVRAAISNSFAVGGTAAVLVVKQCL